MPCMNRDVFEYAAACSTWARSKQLRTSQLLDYWCLTLLHLIPGLACHWILLLDLQFLMDILLFWPLYINFPKRSTLCLCLNCPQPKRQLKLSSNMWSVCMASQFTWCLMCRRNSWTRRWRRGCDVSWPGLQLSGVDNFYGFHSVSTGFSPFSAFMGMNLLCFQPLRGRSGFHQQQPSSEGAAKCGPRGSRPCFASLLSTRLWHIVGAPRDQPTK